MPLYCTSTIVYPPLLADHRKGREGGRRKGDASEGKEKENEISLFPFLILRAHIKKRKKDGSAKKKKKKKTALYTYLLYWDIAGPPGILRERKPSFHLTRKREEKKKKRGERCGRKKKEDPPLSPSPGKMRFGLEEREKGVSCPSWGGWLSSLHPEGSRKGKGEGEAEKKKRNE